MNLSKKNLRKLFKETRENISEKRRKKAEEKAFTFLMNKAVFYKNILSFASKKEEINIWRFNKFLALSKRLFFTKDLEIYKVDYLRNLKLNRSFNLLEPIVEKCKKTENVDMILVPGLAFDHNKRRLGYGQGYYDLLIDRIEERKIYTLGLGFKEQFYEKDLPFEKHDKILDEIALF
ncbi:MAG: hypothetical protein AMS24_01820 [Chlamydiae bacterium SM23_39]|nr:MAG: hypothetical protein AMS24_01820 [Chlamydiae bacterium SM23_39]